MSKVRADDWELLKSVDPASPSPILRAVFDFMDLAVVVANENREIVMINRSAEALFGYREHELLGEQTRLLYASPEDFEEQGRKRFNLSATTHGQDRYTIQYRKKDGTIFVSETHGGPVKDAEGQARFFIGVIEDITARLSAERTLNELHSITSSHQLDFQGRVEAILNLGIRHFGLPIGIFSHIVGDQYTIQQVVDPQRAIAPGTVFELGQTYCTHVLKARRPRGFHHVKDSEISDHPCYRNFGLEAYLGAPVFVNDERYGTLNFSSHTPTRPFIGQDFELLKLFADWIGHELARQRDLDRLHQTQQELEALATTDSLTGLINRRVTELTVTTEIARAERQSQDLCIALIDLDHFKHVNDYFGHSGGDHALRLFADVARTTLRTEDAIGRWGGEEFLMILPHAALGAGTTALERFADQLRNSDFCPEGTPYPLTFSAGITQWRPGDDLNALVSRADKATYQAKTAGRDQICQG